MGTRRKENEGAASVVVALPYKVAVSDYPDGREAPSIAPLGPTSAGV